MIDKNKKERLGEVLTRLGCGQNQRDFILFFIFSHLKANKGAR